MPKTRRENEIKYTRYFDALSTLAPEKTFGGVTLAEFTAQIGESNAPRRRLVELKDETKDQEARIGNADTKTMKMCEKIKNGVVADPDFGDDSALYEALGYVRKSERRSGLTRKKNQPPE